MDTKWVSFDTETTGLFPHKNSKMFAWSTCDWEGLSEVHRIDWEDGEDALYNCGHLRRLAEAGVAGRLGFICHNAKFDLAFLEKATGVRVAETIPLHDTYLQSNILRSDSYSHRLKDLAYTYAGVPIDDEKAIKPYVTAEDGFQKVPEPLMRKYQLRDAERTMLLHQFFFPKIVANPKWLDVYQTEVSLSRVTLRMEQRGIMLHRERCIRLASKLASDAERTLDEAAELIGQRINIGNDNQARKLIYQTLGLKPIAWTKTGLPKVDGDTLRELNDGGDQRVRAILECIRKFSSWSSGATMLRSYLELADEEGIIHPSINTCQARTGRESCSRPNLQNVQKEENFLNPYSVPARSAFRPRPGFVHFHMDFKGVEFRIAVNRTGDAKLMAMAAKEDLHSIGARILFGASVWDAADKKQRKIMRSSGKNANFAKMYGASLRKIGATIGTDIPLSRLREYDAIFGALDGSALALRKGAANTGYVDTSFGRRLWVPRDKPYVAVNYCIQGTAADVIKRAQVRAAGLLKDKTGGEAQILLPIHDEIVIEWPRKRLSEARPILRELREAMTAFPEFTVPLDMDVEVATADWSKKADFILGDNNG